jgi:starch phosphorylase
VKAIRRLTVQTAIPASLSALEELATNLRWSWHIPTRRFFADISPVIWGKLGTDPIDLLASIEPARLEELSRDEGFVSRTNALRDDLHAYL